MLQYQMENITGVMVDTIWRAILLKSSEALYYCSIKTLHTSVFHIKSCISCLKITWKLNILYQHWHYNCGNLHLKIRTKYRLLSIIIDNILCQFISIGFTDNQCYDWKLSCPRIYTHLNICFIKYFVYEIFSCSCTCAMAACFRLKLRQIGVK